MDPWRRSRSRALVATGLLALTLAACGRTGPATPWWGDSTPTGTATPTGTGAAPTATGIPAAIGPTVTAGASPTRRASTKPAPKPSAKRTAARVTVQRTGGFAGVAQKLVVEPDGNWRYTDSRGPGSGRTQTGRLGAAQRERLQLLLGDPAFGSAFYPGNCRDGFHYSLVAGERRVEWDECGRGNPAEVARAIVTLLAAATPL